MYVVKLYLFHYTEMNIIIYILIDFDMTLDQKLENTVEFGYFLI